MLKKHFTILLMLCSFTNLRAQEPIHFTVKEGLPSNHVYDVLEDKDGFIWFATNRGLAKYNGETFKNFTIKNGLPNNDIWLLETDHKDRLWYLSKSKYQGYIENDSIYKFKTEDDMVISPYTHKRDTIFGFYGETYYQFNELQLKKVNNVLNFYNKFTDRYPIIALSFYNIENQAFVALQENEIIFFNKNGKELKKMATSFNLTLEKLLLMIEKRDFTLYKNLIIIHLPTGFVSIDTKSLSYKYYANKDLAITTDHIKTYSKTINNTIQITFGTNLLIFDENFNFQQKHSLPKNILFKRAFKDSQGNIWLVGSGGVYLISKYQLSTQYYLKNKPTKKIGVLNKQLHFGVENDGIYKMNNNQATKAPSLETDGGKTYQIKDNTLVTSLKSYVFINTIPKVLTFENKKLEFFYAFKDFIRWRDSIVAVTSTDVVKLSFTSKKGRTLYRKAGLLELEIFNNTIYVGGSDGLWALKNDSLARPKGQSPTIETSINYIEKTKEYLCVGTDGRGVYVYNENEAIQLKNTDGLIVQKILKQKQKLWLATQKGVIELTINKNDIANSKITNRFLEADGLLQDNVNDIYLDGSNLYAASDIGVAKLNIKNKIYKQQPKPYFKTKKDTLNFSGKARDNITVTFASQNYSNQKNIAYQYRLLPTQEEWQNTSTKTLNFSNLSPELYQLEIKTTDQHFNTTRVIQYMNVIPIWWQTLWAKVGFGIIAFLAFLGIIRLLQKRIQKKEVEKAQLDKKIAGLELLALRSQMNPHFVHNSLNAIQYFIQRNEVDLSEEYLSKFSHLIRSFFEYSRRQTISIQEELELLTHYLDIEKLRFEEKLNYKIIFYENIDTKEQQIPSMLLQPLVENAVNHGLFHKEETGNVYVEFKHFNEGKFTVEIRDDGIGINKSKEIYNASSKNYQSSSSEVLKERLFLLNRSNQWNIEYYIEDRAKINTNETGTIVTLKFTQLNS